MGIKDAFERDQGAFLKITLRSETVLAKEERRLRKKYLQPSTAEVRHIDQLAQVEKLRRVAREDAWGSLSPSEIKNIILSLDYPGNGKLENDEDWVVRNFLNFLASGQPEGNHRRFFSRIARQYLRSFDPSSWVTPLLSKYLCKCAPTIRAPRYLAPLLKAHSDFDLFQWQTGPRNLATHIVGNRKSAHDVFDQIDLHHAARGVGFAEFAFTHACNLVYKRLSNTPNSEDVDRLIACLIFWALSPDKNQIVYQTRYPEIAWALLAPWRDFRRADPSETTKEMLVRFFTDTLGDPRIFDREWERVDSSAKDVLLRWLNLHTLTLFFDIVREVVGEGGRFEHQWHARKRFWEEFVNHGLVTNSIVAFGRAALPRVKHAEKELDRKLLYRALRGAERTQSVLLLHIKIPSPAGGTRTFVVADWSHNGSLRIWRESSPEAPIVAPTPPDVYPEDLRTEPDTPRILHMGPWQPRAYNALLDLSEHAHIREVASMSDFLETIRV